MKQKLAVYPHINCYGSSEYLPRPGIRTPDLLTLASTDMVLSNSNPFYPGVESQGFIHQPTTFIGRILE